MLEIDQFKKEYGEKCKTLFIKRLNIDVPNNESDKNVASYKCNYTIENNGTIVGLEIKAIKLILELQS